jgi:uncharacterized protein
MSNETAERIIENTLCEMSAGDELTFAFQGGEPTLIGLEFFQFFIEKVTQAAPGGLDVQYAIQTNGININESWCRFLRESNFLAGLSLDGDAAMHNRYRKDVHGEGTHKRVMAAKDLFDAYGVNYNILCVLTERAAKQPGRMWDFLLSENIRYVQFIPCMAPLDGYSPTALSAHGFAHFYMQIKRRMEGSGIRVKLFDDLSIGGGTCGQPGMCTPQIVVEADGSVYPCDFYVTDNWRIGSLVNRTIREVFDAVVNCGFLTEKQEMSPHCDGCLYRRMCKGGCKRMRQGIFAAPCGMKMLLEDIQR